MINIFKNEETYYKYNRKSISLKNEIEAISDVDFYNSIRKSSNFNVYNKVEGLIENLSFLITNKKFKAKIFNNITIKTLNNDVIVRFLVKNGSVNIMNNLFGKDAQYNSKDIYLKIYDKYLLEKNTNIISTFEDVILLINIIENNV